MQKRRRQRGFTLIELMIVVVIMSIIGATFVGMAMRMRTKKKTQQSGPSIAARRAVAQTPLQVQRLQADEHGALRLGALVQSVTSSVVDARLHVDYLLDDGRIIPVYQANFEATYHLRNPDATVLLARILFPFPKGAGTFSALHFQVARAGADCAPSATSRPTKGRTKPSAAPILTLSEPLRCTLREPQHNLDMGTHGIAWRYAFAPQEEIRVVVRYRVRGRDQYQYQIAAGKKRQFLFKMHIAGVDPLIPPSALQPSQTKRLLEPQHHLITWDFRDFITSESIEIRFPPEYAKFHRFSLLGRLAWIALLLFAIFFWYFGERERPEALRSNNLTRLNIALVGIGFVSFFPLFLYLEDHLTMRWAFWLGLGCATTLTTIHVALFMGLRWTLWRSLPLQLLITLSFTAAILFPAYRTLILTVASLFLTVALIALNARYQREARAKALLEEEAAINKKPSKNAKKKNASVSANVNASALNRWCPYPLLLQHPPSPSPNHRRSPHNPLLSAIVCIATPPLIRITNIATLAAAFSNATTTALLVARFIGIPPSLRSVIAAPAGKISIRPKTPPLLSPQTFHPLDWIGFCGVLPHTPQGSFAPLTPCWRGEQTFFKPTAAPLVVPRTRLFMNCCGTPIRHQRTSPVPLRWLTLHQRNENQILLAHPEFSVDSLDPLCYTNQRFASVAEPVDAVDSKSIGSDIVGVRVPPEAQRKL